MDFNAARKLREAGFNEDQIDALNVVFETDLATKGDIALVQRDIKGLELKIENVHAGLKKDMLIIGGSFSFLLLTALVTLIQLGLLSPK
ncbi:MAG: hypothetical protein OXB86_00700 [Bdellovibrionales bacterium]|nr:hypothetical protein [Bdellovibrionales bacterium]